MEKELEISLNTEKAILEKILAEIKVRKFHHLAYGFCLTMPSGNRSMHGIELFCPTLWRHRPEKYFNSGWFYNAYDYSSRINQVNRALEDIEEQLKYR
jgi:hypothetical protein